jgi:hypothetical protein
VQSTDLAFYTCDELIQELMRRKTFYGCIIHSADDHKHDGWDERTFRVHFNSNLDQVRAGRLLDAVAERLTLEID